MSEWRSEHVSHGRSAEWHARSVALRRAMLDGTASIPEVNAALRAMLAEPRLDGTVPCRRKKRKYTPASPAGVLKRQIATRTYWARRRALEGDRT